MYDGGREGVQERESRQYAAENKHQISLLQDGALDHRRMSVLGGTQVVMVLGLVVEVVEILPSFQQHVVQRAARAILELCVYVPENERESM